MDPGEERSRRVDAVRNAERILDAARRTFATSGPAASLEEIARAAGVGTRTLYRHYSCKEDLVRAALDHAIAQDLTPAVQHALRDEDPLRGLVTLIESTLSMVARQRSTLIAADVGGLLTSEVTAPFLDTLSVLLDRAQQAGSIRPDLVADDLRRIVGMLTGVLSSREAGSDDWRRYLTLVMDGLSPRNASPLPPATPIETCTHPDTWPG